jgi:hypothetical protein
MNVSDVPRVPKSDDDRRPMSDRQRFARLGGALAVAAATVVGAKVLLPHFPLFVADMFGGSTIVTMLGRRAVIARFPEDAPPSHPTDEP